jgi:extradiol dioxygenase family protein
MARAIDGVLRSALLGLACLVPWALPATAADTAGPPAKPTIRWTASTGGATAASAAQTRISGQATFLYYKDLVAPRKFYTEVLGLVPYFETEWVTLYHPVAGATIGLVKEPGSDTSAKIKRSVVMVSLVTDDVAGWYRKLRHRRGVHIVKALYDHPAVPIRAFEIEDPAGYPVEFFQWLDPAPQ